MKEFEYVEGYCPELDEYVEICVEYSYIRRLGTTKETLAKRKYYCSNLDTCKYRQSNQNVCPIFHEAPEEIPLS